MKDNCPNTPKCPIFNGILSDKKVTAKSYRRQFCEADKINWSSCKRFMAKEMYGKCPSDLLPNSGLSIEQIGLKYNLI